MSPLPSPETLLEPVVKCLPQWARRYESIPRTTVSSGCGLPRDYLIRFLRGDKTAGNIQCRPEDMARRAGVPLDAYTLARYASGEVGKNSIFEIVAVMQAAVNRAVHVEKLSNGILSLLLYRQVKDGVRGPNYGWYGPIHGWYPNGQANTKESPAPFGRWATTGRDPTKLHLVLARDVLNGTIPFDFSKGADDQYGLEYKIRDHGVADVQRRLQAKANKRSYWVGPLLGVDSKRTFLFRSLPTVDPASALGQQLTRRMIAQATTGRDVWANLPPCEGGRADSATSTGSTSNTGKIVVGSLLISGGLIAMAVAARKPI